MKLNIQLIIIPIIAFCLLITCSRNNENGTLQKIDSIPGKNSLKTIKNEKFDTLAGKQVYEAKCMVCHQENGQGVSGTFPPLAASDYLIFDKQRALKNVIHGFKDSIIVNGQTYRGNTMPDIELSDKQLKDVMDYILNSWGNKGGIVSLEDVKKAR